MCGTDRYTSGGEAQSIPLGHTTVNLARQIRQRQVDMAITYPIPGSFANAVDGHSYEHVVIICMPRVQINTETPCTLWCHAGGYAQTQF